LLTTRYEAKIASNINAQVRGNMQLGWIDFSKEERNKIVSILRLLGTQTAVDELGIGTIRDAFSDMLFPGISTLQTRAKYFVLIPYLFMLAEREKFSNFSDVRLWITKQEDLLVKTLIENSGEVEGIIGNRIFKQGRNVKYKPSILYWNGLRTLGILRYPKLSMDDAFRITYQHSVKNREISLKSEGVSDAADDVDAINDSPVIFSPIKPTYDVLTQSKINLTKNEAEYLFHQFTKSENAKDSLLKYMLENHLVFESFEDFETDNLPVKLKETVRLAQDFADFIYGAHLLYNVIYSDGKDQNIENSFNQWKGSSNSIIDIKKVLEVSNCHGMTEKFILEFDKNIREGNVDAAKQLIIARERFIKRDRAKLCKPEQFRYESPRHDYKLDYRYGNASLIIKDILKGME